MIAVVGSGLSLTGYNESQQLTTLTSAYNETTTSTGIVTLASTTTRVVTTTYVATTIHSEGTLGGATCQRSDMKLNMLNEMLIHIWYTAQGGVVDFWLLDEASWNDLSQRTCETLRSVNGIAHQFGLSAWDLFIMMPSGVWYLAFSAGRDSVVGISVRIDFVMPRTIATVTEVHTGYSTHASTIITETTNLVSQPAGLGMPFFSGIGLLAVAVIAIAAVAMKRRRETVSLSAASAATTPSPPQGPQGKFCMNCGASLPSHATYCNKCGSKQ